MAKRVLKIDGYNVSIPDKGYYTILVDRQGTVVEFEDLTNVQRYILERGLEADEYVDAYVVADHNGAYTLD